MYKNNVELCPQRNNRDPGEAKPGAGSPGRPALHLLEGEQGAQAAQESHHSSQPGGASRQAGGRDQPAASHLPTRYGSLIIIKVLFNLSTRPKISCNCPLK